jgi:hypothetical protein
MSTLEWIAVYIELLPILVFLFFIKQKVKLEKPLWVILFYSTCSFINNVKVAINYLNGKNSLLYLYIFTIVEYSLFALFIYTILQKAYLKRALLICSILFTSFCLFNIFFQPKYEFDSLQTSIESLILIIFCILFLFEEVNKPQVTFIYASYKFWIILGILVYLAITFFLYSFAASMPLETSQRYWFISNYGNILKNILFAIALLIHAKASGTQKPIESGYRPFLN